MLGCFFWLARRSGNSSCKANGWRSVCCILLGSVCAPLRVRSARPSPRCPTECLATCELLFFDAFFQTRDLPHASHARSVLSLWTVLRASRLHMTPACENLTHVVVHLLTVFFLATDQGGGPVLLARARAEAVGVVLCVTFLPWVSEHHRVPRFHPADASQCLLSCANLVLRPTVHAVIVDDSNVSLTNVDDVFCLLPSL